MKGVNYSLFIKQLSRNKFLRSHLIKQIDKHLYRQLVKEDDKLFKIKKIRYQYLSAMLQCTARNLDKGYVSNDVVEKLADVLVGNSFQFMNNGKKELHEEFEATHGMVPPNFLVLSPTQRCNLNCTGCYAGSTAKTSSTLPYDIIEKIIDEAYNKMHIRFITISGGEPFIYKDNGKTMLYIFEKYNDIFFLVYTNGLLIDQETAYKLKELGNVTPAISIEGFEEQTDKRRGKGTHKKILQVFENLRNAGVPFGISVTGTSENVDVLLDDSFYDYYFDDQGVTYMWQFQLMPMGRANEAFDLMITPEDRLKLYRKWEYILEQKRYCIADFWNSGVITNGCIAYGKEGGYFYIDWHGNITPCVFIPYYVDNIYELYKNGRSLVDALKSGLMKNGRKWQDDYGMIDAKEPKNLLMPCSIRDHYDNFRKNILNQNIEPADSYAEESLKDDEFYNRLVEYDNRLCQLTQPIWEKEFVQNE